MAADPVGDLVVTIGILLVIVIAAWLVLRYATKGNPGLSEKRSSIQTLLKFYLGKTVPTIRITSDRGIVALELGKRARFRENSLIDSVDQKGWEIRSPAIPIISGNNMELGYLTHPKGMTVDLVPKVNVIKTDQEGNKLLVDVFTLDENGERIPVLDEKKEPIPGKFETHKEYDFIEANFEGTVGRLGDLDDFNQAIEFIRSGSWVVPLVIGIFAGVFGFAPLFAWLMGMLSGGH